MDGTPRPEPHRAHPDADAPTRATGKHRAPHPQAATMGTRATSMRDTTTHPATTHPTTKHSSPYSLSVSLSSAWLSALILAGFAGVGGWQRRWMSDDGLIVLRTVRNLLAGNGPVFNAGERVEANTSTLWQYLIYVGALLTPARLEIIALWLALGFTVAAMVAASLGSAKLYRVKGSALRSRLLFVPLGGLVYLALPPARDFATSGLEWGLSIFWVAVLWWVLVTWVRNDSPGVLGFAALWCGLSWLVRPELALYGAIAGLVLLLGAGSWRRRGLIMAAALPLPAGYQLFRMAYYGLLVPQTAVAKSASDAEWSTGWAYVTDLFEPYSLLFGVVAAAVAGVLVAVWFGADPRLLASRASGAGVSVAAADGEDSGVMTSRGLRVRRPVTVVVVMLLCGVLHGLYVVRVGGDFMHGRMLLIPLFALLCPLMVVPVWLLAAGDAEARGRGGVITHSAHSAPSPGSARTTSVKGGARGRAVFPVLAVVAAAAAGGWAIATAHAGTDWQPPDKDPNKELGVIDEREFWMWFSGHTAQDPPLVASDFLDIDRMWGYEEAIERAYEQPTGMILSIQSQEPGHPFNWMTVPGMEPGTPDPDGLVTLRPTVAYINLGMTGMNAPLDIRVVDTVGLANPVAARQPRIEGGRIGHDKMLPLEWALADSSTRMDMVPGYISTPGTIEARRAIHTDDFVRIYRSYRQPWSPRVALSNIKFALTRGRTIELEKDPEDYRDQPEVPGAVLAWPTEIHLDDREG